MGEPQATAASASAPRVCRCLHAGVGAIAVVLLAACASRAPAPAPSLPAPAPAPVATPAPAPAAPTWPEAAGDVAGRGERLLVYVPAAGDTLSGIATRFMGAAQQAWQIADANGTRWTPEPGQPLIVPLTQPNPTGVFVDGVQAVPILCYHRFGPGQSRMIVSAETFEAQMDWLARNHYTVLRLADLPDFLAGQRALPQRSVVITIDDGYETVHRHALPALRKHGFPATLFVYTDFIGARDATSWAQLQEMAASGLIDIQAHSRTHRNLIQRGDGETEAAYRQAIEDELRTPRTVLERRLGAVGVKVRHFAYPFGDANELVLDAMQRLNYELGVTVNPGGNAFFAQPLMLRRTMIFGDHDLDDFKARLQTRRPLARP